VDDFPGTGLQLGGRNADFLQELERAAAHRFSIDENSAAHRLHAEHASRPRDIPIGLLERTQQMIPLRRFTGLMHGRPRSALALHAQLNRNRGHRNHFLRCQDRHPFNHVAQFAQVTRPRILPHRIERR